MTADLPADAQPMALVRVPDGEGGYRHEFRPVPAEKPKARKKPRTPDPIHANPDASAQQLKQLIERIERMEEEKAGISEDIRDAYSEGKAVGFDTKTIRAIIALRKMNPEMRREAEDILETYKAALGIA